MHLNIRTFVSLAAVVLIEVSCDADPKLEQEKTELGLEWLRARGLERRKRTPISDWSGNKNQTNGWWQNLLDSFRSSMDPTDTFDAGGNFGEEISNTTARSHVIRPETNGREIQPWETDEPTTKSIVGGCILPEQPIGGTFRLISCVGSCSAVPGNTVPTGSILIYNCSERYMLRGNVSFCSHGVWYNTPTCVKTCTALKSKSLDISCVRQGRSVSCEFGVAPGTTASSSCKPSYRIPLAGEPVHRDITCMENGEWDRHLFHCIPKCGTPVARGNPFIVNGIPAERNVFPWNVAIYDKKPNGDHEQICGGSLISPSLVVSAGHCFYDDTTERVNNRSRYVVAAGKHNRLYNWPERNVQKSTLEDIIVAPRYMGRAGNYADDIALLRLQDPFNLTTFIRPICIDWENTHERTHLQEGKVGKAVGWGKNESGIPSLELQELNLPYIPFGQCSSSVPDDFRGFLTRDKFCAGWLNGSSLCNGDSGSGLAFQIENLWYLRGVVSVGPVSRGLCDYRYYTAFTNVGTFLNWIRTAYTQEE